MRFDEFERRARLAPTSVEVHPKGWRYIGIHPFADDTELLRRIGVEPSGCIAVDAWCQFGDDVSFVEVHARDGKEKVLRDGVHIEERIIGPDAPMLRALRRAEAPWGVTFFSVAAGPVVDRASFEIVVLEGGSIMTHSMASFYTNKIWAWLQRGRRVWAEGEAT